MAKRDRMTKMLALLQEQRTIPIRQLAHDFQVSEMTVRRDLGWLQSTGTVEVRQGIAFFRQDPEAADSYNLVFHQTKSKTEKEIIGKRAAEMIEPGDVILVDIGTTTVHIARNVPFGAKITAVCFTMNSLTALQQKNVEHLIVSGGIYHKDTQAFESVESLAMLFNIRAGKAFLSAAGASMEMGLTCVNQYEVQLKKACLNNAVEKILLIDSSKFGTVRSAHFADWEQISTVITDQGISPAWRSFLSERGIELIIAE